MGGTRYSVFDVFERWSASEIPTFTVDVECSSDDDAQALVDLFDAHAFAAEDWTKSVRYLCETCSRGLPDGSGHRHDTVAARAHHFGLACPLALARRLLDEWLAVAPQERRYAGPREA